MQRNEDNLGEGLRMDSVSSPSCPWSQVIKWIIRHSKGKGNITTKLAVTEIIYEI